MNNLRTDKAAGIKELIEATGAKVIYLLGYSPDLNPIELCWSKLKAYIREQEVRNFGALGKAISDNGIL